MATESGNAERVRAGVIGPSGIGRTHIESLRRIGVEVTALAASTPERSRDLAAKLGVPGSCASAGELVERDDVDVVHVCTPNHLHHEQALLALEAGKHVVCEKPLATTAAQAEQLLAVAEQSGRVHAVAYNYRAYPMVQAARASVADGRLGRVHLVHGAYLLDEVLQIAEPSHWMLDPDRVGPALALADVGVHWWDLVEHVTGQRAVEVICARQSARDPAAPGEDSAALIMRMSDGAVAVGVVSNAAPGHGNSVTIEINGTRASTWWSQENPDLLWSGELGEGVVQTRRSAQPSGVTLASTLQLPAGQPQGYLDAFRDTLAAVYAAIRGLDGGPDYPTFTDGVRGVRVLEALIESDTRQEWARVED